MKWNVLVGSSGTPAALSTPPPVPFVVASQSPVLAPGVFAIKSPSIAKPPVGIVTGAMPLGGGVANAAKLHSSTLTRKSRATDFREETIRASAVLLLDSINTHSLS